MSLPYPCLSRAFFPCHLIQAQESHEPSLLELAKLHLRRAELESCQKLCQGLLKVNENHEEASIMLADIMFRKDDVDVRDRRLKSSGSPSCLPICMFVFAPLLSIVFLFLAWASTEGNVPLPKAARAQPDALPGSVQTHFAAEACWQAQRRATVHQAGGAVFTAR